MIRLVQIAVPLYIVYTLLPMIANFYHAMNAVANVLP